MQSNKIIGIVLLFLMGSDMLWAQQNITYENFPKATMMFIGVPLEFDNNDANAVWGPIFGDNGAGEWWRFSRWNIGDHTYYRYGESEYIWDHNAQAYQAEKAELGAPHPMEPGYGYWLSQSSANTVTDFTLTGNPVNQSEAVYVPIDPPQTVEGHVYPGISMVANPFLYTIDWANAEFRINGSQELTLAQAVNMGLVSQYAYPWDGSQYTPYNMTDGGNFDLWDGYWVEQLNPEETEYVVYDVACDIESSEGGGDDCGVCPEDDLKITWLQLRYDGSQEACVVVLDKKKKTLFDDDVSVGGTFDFNGAGKDLGMGSKISVYVYYNNKCEDPDAFVEIHTSCSVAIGPGQQWGLFTIMAGNTKEGLELCPVGETNKPIVTFYDADAGGAEADLGDDGAIETDRFIVSLTGSDNDELFFKIVTVSNDSSDWIALSEVGSPVSDGQGFTATLVNEDEDDYTIDVASTGTAAMEAIKFRFGDDQTIDSPGCGETYTATRTLLGGVEVSSLELKTPAIEVGSKLAKGNYPLKAQSTSEWIVPMYVGTPDEEMVDHYSGFGVKEGASVMYDPMDARNFTPNLSAYVDLYFPHHEESNPLSYWPQNPMKAAFDVRPPNEDVIAWDLNMDYYMAADQRFTLSWDASQFPTEMELTLVDFDTGERVDMLTNSEYAITTPADPYGTRYFAVVAAVPEEIVGIGEESDHPRTFELMRNYPNPFNATTNIRYQLPVTASVRLDIYNISGELIRTLVNANQAPGQYLEVWTGRDGQDQDVGSGVYFYRLQVDGQMMTQKMIYLK